MTRLQAHRGVSSECPENTMPAFLLAIEQGYNAIELDPLVTRDLQVVILHDDTINRTGRNPDGSRIDRPIRVDASTYEELLAYDFGIFKHPKFEGTKLPLLSELLPIAREAGVTLKLDAKILKLSEAHQQAIFDLVRAWPDVCEFSTKTLDQTLALHEQFPDFQLHYGGPCEQAALEIMSEAVGADRLNIWLPYPNLRTAYAYAHLQGLKPEIIQVPVLTAERAFMAKKYGKVCVWNLADEAEYIEVQTLGVHIAETSGEVKPVRNLGVRSDMHTHTEHSHDCTLPMPLLYEACRAKGIKIIAACDHYDGMFCADGPYDYTHILESVREADAITAQYGGDGMVLRGIELGEGNWDLAQTKKVIADGRFDVVVGSIHAVRTPLLANNTGLKRAYSQLKYDQLTVPETYRLISDYFDEMLEMVQTVDMDICAHLTCVVGYFHSRHGIVFGVEQFRDKITAILQVMIQKGIALEVNFSRYADTGVTTPHLWIIRLYRELGGYLIAMATDAHGRSRCGKGYDEGIALLKKEGFRHIFYYKDRKPVQCTLI